MPNRLSDETTSAPALQAYLLGTVGFDACQELQCRLISAPQIWGDGQVHLLVCEHPPILTVGRSSGVDAWHLATLLGGPRLERRWVKRGGGCLLHGPGQLAVYPVVSLRWRGWTVGEYLRRLATAVRGTFEQLGIKTEDDSTFSGRTGSLAALGVTVQNGIASNGAFINVSPPMGLLRSLQGCSPQATRISCLVAERQRPVKMTSVRAELVRQVADALGCDHYHLHTGHPLLKRARQSGPICQGS